MNRVAFILSFMAFAFDLYGETLEQKAAREVLVKFREVPARLDAALIPHSASVRRVKFALSGAPRGSELEKIASIEVIGYEEANDIVRALQSDLRVQWAETRRMRYVDARLVERTADHLDAPPNDPFYSQQWYLDNIEAQSAWDVVEPDSTVLIAVVDDGVYFGLTDLQAARWNNSAELSGLAGVDDDGNGFVDDLHGYDFMQFDGDPTPDPLDGYNSHGTHVAGIAAATRNNRVGIAGVAGGARIMAVRVGQGGTIPYGFEGVYYACRAGARVINCSWGGGTESAYEREIVNYVRGQGCVIVCSAGNNGNSVPRYPAGIEGVLSVAASTESNTAAPFTNFGPWVKISAPGVHILSTVVDGTYGAWQGTSMAAPVVAGVCALIGKNHPGWSSDQIVTAVCNSADPIDSVNDTLAGRVGLGRVNAYRALSNFETPRGVRFTSLRFHETVGDGDNRIEAAEQAFLDIEIANQHGAISGVTGSVHSMTDSITVSPSQLIYPSPIGNGFWWSDFDEPRILMPEMIARGAVLPVSMEWRDGSGQVVGRATTSILLDTTFAQIETSALRFALGEQGALGYFDYVRNIPMGPGLALRNELSNALYHGSIFVGVNGKVIDNYYGDSTGSRFDWTALPGAYARSISSEFAPVAVNSRFDDRTVPEQERVEVEVNATLMSWPDVESGFVLELTALNRGNAEWHDAYCGLMMDWDLGPASRNYGAFDDGGSILFVRSELVTLPFVGMAGLEHDLVTAYEIGNRDELQMGGLTASRAWQFVTSGIGGFSEAPRDLSHIAALALPALQPGDSSTARLAILTGNSVSSLRETLHQLQEKLGFEFKVPPAHEVGIAKSHPNIAPNPIAAGQRIVVSGTKAGAVSLTLFNILGQQVARFSQEHAAAGRIDFGPLPVVAPGVLFYKLEHPAGLSAGKMLLLP